MVNVLMFGWEFPPLYSGGLGVACEGLVKSLVKQNTNITLVLPYDSENEIENCTFKSPAQSVVKKTKFIKSPIVAYDTQESYRRKHLLSKTSSKGLRKLYGEDLIEEVHRYAYQVEGILDDEELSKIDVIHAHDWLTYMAGVEAKRISGKPLIIHVHATEYDRNGGGEGVNPHVFSIEKIGMQEADRIIAVSQFTKQKLIKHYNVPAEKIEVVHNGVLLDNWDKLEHGHTGTLPTPLVTFLGRITLQKGPIHFLEAARKALEYNPELHFLIAGSGDMLEEAIEKAAEYGISESVFFTGKFYTTKQAKWILSQTDVFVMPSLSEPFGIVPLEAMSCHVPTIVTKQSGVSEVLTNCLKVDFWDTNKMADYMINIVEHEPLHTTLKHSGREEVTMISWDKPASNCINIYKKLM